MDEKVNTPMFTSHRTLLLIIVLAVITGVLFVWAIKPKTATQPVSQESSPTPITASQAQSVLSISPSMVELQNTSGSVDVVLDTKDNLVTAVQLEISYDPTKLTNVEIAPATFFEKPLVLIKNIDEKNGKISYALALQGNATAKTGNAPVATITFTSLMKDQEETTLDILDKSLITAEGISESVLKESHDGTIMYKPASSPVVPLGQ